MSKIAVTVKRSPFKWDGWVCRVKDKTYYAPTSGGLFTPDWVLLLSPLDFSAYDVSSARWLVRRALRGH